MGRNATTTSNCSSDRTTIEFIGSLASPHESCGLACYTSVITSSQEPTKSARLALLANLLDARPACCSL
jgi:hypothetical protein